MEQRKVMLVTGGAMGQGRAHALKYAENGYDVVLADMLETNDERFADTIAQADKLGANGLGQ